MKNFFVTGDRFELFNKDELVAESRFSIEEPDDLFNSVYVGLFKLETTKEFRRKGYASLLLIEIFDYVKNELGIDNILLNVYKDNYGALNLYFNNGFKIYREYDDYFTLLKHLYSFSFSLN